MNIMSMQINDVCIHTISKVTIKESILILAGSESLCVQCNTILGAALGEVKCIHLTSPSAAPRG